MLAFAGMGLSMFFLSKIAGKFKMPGFVNGGKSGEARAVAKLETLANLQRETLAVQNKILDQQKNTHESIKDLIINGKIEDERHKNVKEQLTRIENHIKDSE